MTENRYHHGNLRQALLDAATAEISRSQGREITLLRTEADTLRTAAARLGDALAEQRLATDAETRRADRHRRERNVLAVVATILAGVALTR